MAIAVAIGEAVLVLVLRAHYTMDVISGAFAAWFAADMAARLAPFVDGWLKWSGRLTPPVSAAELGAVVAHRFDDVIPDAEDAGAELLE